MRENRVFAIFVLTLSLAPAATAQEGAAPKAQVELFLAAVSRGEVEAAVDGITRGSLIAAKPQQLTLLKGQITAALPLYGAPVGNEAVHEEAFGSSIRRLVYIQKFEHHPLIWEFYFYRGGETWSLVNFRFEDQMTLLARMSGQ